MTGEEGASNNPVGVNGDGHRLGIEELPGPPREVTLFERQHFWHVRRGRSLDGATQLEPALPRRRIGGRKILDEIGRRSPTTIRAD